MFMCACSGQKGFAYPEAVATGGCVLPKIGTGN